MEAESVLITGASQGIGLEFVRQFVKLPKPPKYIFATYRDRKKVEVLKNLKYTSKDTLIMPLKMDVTNAEHIENVRYLIEDVVGDKGLNLLINNAAVLSAQKFVDITEENMVNHFTTNTVAPVMVLKAMFPLLQQAAAHGRAGMNTSKAAVLNISSMGGSSNYNIERELPRGRFDAFSYRISKAALNMAMKRISLAIEDQGILIVNMCPGWVKTTMGTSAAQLEVTESVYDMLNTLTFLNQSHHGTFIDRKGEMIPY